MDPSIAKKKKHSDGRSEEGSLEPTHKRAKMRETQSSDPLAELWHKGPNMDIWKHPYDQKLLLEAWLDMTSTLEWERFSRVLPKELPDFDLLLDSDYMDEWLMRLPQRDRQAWKRTWYYEILQRVLDLWRDKQMIQSKHHRPQIEPELLREPRQSAEELWAEICGEKNLPNLSHYFGENTFVRNKRVQRRHSTPPYSRYEHLLRQPNFVLQSYDEESAGVPPHEDPIFIVEREPGVIELHRPWQKYRPLGAKMTSDDAWKSAFCEKHRRRTVRAMRTITWDAGRYIPKEFECRLSDPTCTSEELKKAEDLGHYFEPKPGCKEPKEWDSGKYLRFPYYNALESSHSPTVQQANLFGLL